MVVTFTFGFLGSLAFVSYEINGYEFGNFVVLLKLYYVLSKEVDVFANRDVLRSVDGLSVVNESIHGFYLICWIDALFSGSVWSICLRQDLALELKWSGVS